MKNSDQIRVIIDANCWISFLISRRMSFIVDILNDNHFVLIYSNLLLSEILEVTQRPKFKKYFAPNDIQYYVQKIAESGEYFEQQNLEQRFHECRDIKDEYLLDLAVIGNADYLITGDNDLLVLNSIGQCIIVKPHNFVAANIHNNM